MGKSFACLRCNAPIAARAARCRSCGWASDYNRKATWRQRREILTGVSLLGAAVVFAVALVVTMRLVVLPHL
jgi:ribosomal protein L40E